MQRAFASVLARRIRSGYAYPCEPFLRRVVTSQGSDPAATGSPDGLTAAGGRLAIDLSSLLPSQCARCCSRPIRQQLLLFRILDRAESSWKALGVALYMSLLDASCRLRLICCSSCGMLQYLRYHARMEEQVDSSFASALRQALDKAEMTQAALAGELHIDAGQVSRWCNGRAIPHKNNILRINGILGIDLSKSFAESKPTYELFVSTPISGLDSKKIPQHHDAVAAVVAAARQHVNSLAWPGEQITTDAILRNDAADIVTERNMTALHGSRAYLYLQFAEVVGPSSSFVELGFALGRRMKITIIVKQGLRSPHMLKNYGTVAANLDFLPNARMYTVASAADAASLIESNGRVLLGLA